MSTKGNKPSGSKSDGKADFFRSIDPLAFLKPTSVPPQTKPQPAPKPADNNADKNNT
jgi:hypothetical protein